MLERNASTVPLIHTELLRIRKASQPVISDTDSNQCLAGSADYSPLQHCCSLLFPPAVLWADYITYHRFVSEKSRL